MKITYGIANNNIDVTEICYKKLIKQNIIKIPSNDNNRATYFSDPLCNILKSIFIIDENENLIEYDHLQTIYIDVVTNKIYTNTNIPSYINDIYPNIHEKLSNIHRNLKIEYGNFQEEYPEQMMSARYLTGYENVLEIGGNIGRNALVISYILSQKNNYNFVTLESDTDIAVQLEYNKNLNNLNFNIENSALSKRKLIQSGWNTVVSDTLLDGYKEVKTITLDELNNKYNIMFDTLVLDCEGAFYYILIDMPEILNNIKLIIMENDYNNIEHKNYVDNILKQNKFYVDYVEAGGWGFCFNNFFEVWKREL